jgi:hypothetical protein
MFRFLKKDSYLLGGIMGIIIPAALWGILHTINSSISTAPGSIKPAYFTDFMVQIVSLVPNILLLRYYLINLKADKTGRGILAVTFVIAIVLFILNM